MPELTPLTLLQQGCQRSDGIGVNAAKHRQQGASKPFGILRPTGFSQGWRHEAAALIAQ
jgi:hypothetical protein